MSITDKFMSIHKNIAINNCKYEFKSEFTLEIPFGTNIFVEFNLLNDNVHVYIPSDDPSMLLLQAIIYETFDADLQFVNNYKDGTQIPVNGGGNLLLDIWDWIANLFDVHQTNIIDMTKLRNVLSINDFDILGEDYDTISFRLLSMILDKNNYTWYERHGYFILDNNELNKNMVARSSFMELPVDVLLYLIKLHIKMHYICIVRHNMYAKELPFLITLYKKCYYNKNATLKSFLTTLWINNTCEYSILEKIILSAQDKNINKCMSIMHNEELEFTKLHEEVSNKRNLRILQ